MSLKGNSNLKYSKVINLGNVHPEMKNVKNQRMPMRMVYDFPVGENVLCNNGGAEMGSTSNSRYIDIKHKVTVPDIRTGKEGKTLTKYFKDRYFFYNNSEDKVTSSNSERLIYRYIKFIGGENRIKDGGSLTEFISNSIDEINNNVGVEYFLKTRLRLNEKTYKLYLERGNFPYFSMEKDLKYENGEAYEHEYTIYGTGV